MEPNEANEAYELSLGSVDQQRFKQNLHIVVAGGGRELRVNVVNLRTISSDLSSATLCMKSCRLVSTHRQTVALRPPHVP